MAGVTEALYIGERLDLLGNIHQVFRDRKGREYRFKGVKRLTVGDSYPIENETIKTRPEAIDHDKRKLTMGPADWAEYEAHKGIVKLAREEAKRRMDLKRPHPDIKKAIDLLRPFVRGLSMTDQRRFIDYVHNEASRKGGRR